MAYLVKLRAVGNGWVLTLPRQLCRELAWPPGTYVIARRTRDNTVTLTTLGELTKDARHRDPRNPR